MRSSTASRVAGAARVCCIPGQYRPRPTMSPHDHPPGPCGVGVQSVSASAAGRVEARMVAGAPGEQTRDALAQPRRSRPWCRGAALTGELSRPVDGLRPMRVVQRCCCGHALSTVCGRFCGLIHRSALSHVGLPQQQRAAWPWMEARAMAADGIDGAMRSAMRRRSRCRRRSPKLAGEHDVEAGAQGGRL